MEEKLLGVGDLARARKLGELVGSTAKAGNKVIGKVIRLRTDKYGRVDGLYVESAQNPEETILVPYDRILGYLESEKVIKVDLPGA